MRRKHGIVEAGWLPHWFSMQVHPNARKKVATPKPGSEEEAALHREQSEALVRQGYQEGECMPVVGEAGLSDESVPGALQRSFSLAGYQVTGSWPLLYGALPAGLISELSASYQLRKTSTPQARPFTLRRALPAAN